MHKQTTQRDYFDSIGHKACSQPERRQVVKSAVIVIDMVSVQNLLGHSVASLEKTLCPA